MNADRAPAQLRTTIPGPPAHHSARGVHIAAPGLFPTLVFIAGAALTVLWLALWLTL